MIAGSERGQQENVNVWNTVLEENGLKINKSKTKVMVILSFGVDIGIVSGRQKNRLHSVDMKVLYMRRVGDGVDKER